MTSPDDEFDDFLRRRRPVFRRDDELEPPPELDRLVLRQARDAIEGERPQRVFRAPSWGMPVALAATLVLAFTIILRVGTTEVAKTPEVTVRTVARQIEAPAPASPPPTAGMPVAAAPAEAPAIAAQENDSGPMVVDIGAGEARTDSNAAAETIVAPEPEQHARRLEKVADAAQPARNSMSAGSVSEEVAGRVSQDTAAAAPAAAAVPKPEYRRDSKSWLAEIDRLRAAGENARADAELAEYKREHRAYAGAPDR